MKEPSYKPQQWVLYELEEDHAGFGHIVGGIYDGDGWSYQVQGPTPNGDNVEVPEDSVKFILENGNWTAPQHFSGSNSAYAAGAPTA